MKRYLFMLLIPLVLLSGCDNNYKIPIQSINGTVNFQGMTISNNETVINLERFPEKLMNIPLPNVRYVFSGDNVTILITGSNTIIQYSGDNVTIDKVD